MACVYSIDGGKTYLSESEFKNHLRDNLDIFISDKSIDLIRTKEKSKPETGISEEVRSKQRKELGLPELPPIEYDKSKHTFDALNNEANRLVDSGEVSYNVLAQSILDGKVKTDDLGKAILNRGVTELGNKIIDAKVEIDKARSIGDKVADERASDDWLKALSDLNDIHKALKITGREAGQSLGAMKLSQKADYSTGSLYARYRAANGDKQLPREMIDRIDTYAVQIEELNVRIKAAEELAEAQGKQIKELQKQKPSSKEKITKIREKRKSIFDEWKQYRDGSAGPVKNSPLPISDKDIAFAAKIAASYIEEGYATTMEVVKQLKADVKKYAGIKLSDEDIGKILDSDVDGKKVVDHFENTGIPSSKESLIDIVNKAEKEIDKIGEEKTQRPKQTEKEKVLIQNTNKALNDLKVAREKLKRKVDHEIGAIEFANRSTSTKIKEGVVDVLNVPRSLMASFDFSAPLRQGLVASVAHPFFATKATVEMFKQFASAKNFEDWLINYKLSPKYELAQKSELYVADPSELHLNGHEEAFMSNLAEKIPIIKYGIKASERAYVGYLNKLRTDVFENLSQELIDQKKTFESHPEDFKALADFVNNSTGRGKLPGTKLEEAAPALNTILFSPRLIASRVNLLNVIPVKGVGYYASMPPSVRIMAIKDVAKFAGVAGVVLGLAELSGADVEDDPRSSDFGKIKVGDTRYDVLGGFQQYIHLAAEIAKGEKKSTTTGKIQSLSGDTFPNQTEGDVVMKFGRQKLAPASGMLVDFLQHKDILGQPTTLWKELYQHFTPIQMQDGIEAYKIGGMSKVLQVMIPSMFGVGVNTYDNKKKKKTLEDIFAKRRKAAERKKQN